MDTKLGKNPHMMRLVLNFPAKLLGMFIFAAAMNRRIVITQNSRNRYKHKSTGGKNP